MTFEGLRFGLVPVLHDPESRRRKERTMARKCRNETETN